MTITLDSTFTGTLTEVQQLTEWDKLLLRLQSIANDKNGNKYAYASTCPALICVNLLYSTGGELLGWHKPQRIELEPKTLDWMLLPCKPVKSWEQVVSDLQEGMNNCTLIVKSGKPVAWLIKR